MGLKRLKVSADKFFRTLLKLLIVGRFCATVFAQEALQLSASYGYVPPL
jgi:hypothetical protein